jgi:hypothetical protein
MKYAVESELSKLYIFIGILGTLLVAKWNGAAFVEVHGRLLDAMAPFLRTSPDATLSVLNKIFELLTSLPVPSKVSICKVLYVTFSHYGYKHNGDNHK